jgi:hypothetical protein
MRPLKAALPQAGVYHQDIMVINSATVVSVPFLAEIGGYNEEFALDYLDHWFSWKVFEEQRWMQVLSPKIQHELSVLSSNAQDEGRYENILLAEKKFFRDYHSELYQYYQKQLIARIGKYLLKGNFASLKMIIKVLLTKNDQNKF